MKKIIVAALVCLSLISTLSACSDNNAPGTKSSTALPTVSESVKTALPTETKESAFSFSGEAYRSGYLATDYKGETVYCIGHKSPDTDTVMSAIAMADLLNSIGINAQARVSERVSAETEYALEYCGIAPPEVLSDASGKQIWMVDHSTSTQAIAGIDNALIVGITDHHALGDIIPDEYIPISVAKYASNCTQILREFLNCGIEINETTAKVLFMGILSDTENLEKTATTDMDREALSYLCKLLKISDPTPIYEKMLEAKLSFKGMTEREIFYNDYKDYSKLDVKYGIACIDVANTDMIPSMAERMVSVLNEEAEMSENDFIIVKISDVKSTQSWIYFAGKDPTNTNMLMSTAFGQNEFLKEFEGNRMKFSPSISRKTVMTPAINKALESSVMRPIGD